MHCRWEWSSEWYNLGPEDIKASFIFLLIIILQHNQVVRVAGEKENSSVSYKLNRPLELLLWSNHWPLGDKWNSLVMKLLQSTVALNLLVLHVNLHLIFFCLRDWIILAYFLTSGPTVSTQHCHLPPRTECLSFRKSQLRVINPSLYLNDGYLSRRSLNSGTMENPTS